MLPPKFHSDLVVPKIHVLPPQGGESESIISRVEGLQEALAGRHIPMWLPSTPFRELLPTLK